jgi:hypothetical protein
MRISVELAASMAAPMELPSASQVIGSITNDKVPTIPSSRARVQRAQLRPARIWNMTTASTA